MTGPFVTVVIPTHDRPELLRRAVASCRADMAPGPVEVIIVANGGARPTAIGGEPDVTVRLLEIEDANANLARNVGLEASRGRFVRFLDDDDFLVAPGVLVQHQIADATLADVCSGAIDVLDPAGRATNRIAVSGDDLAQVVLAPRHATLPAAHVYRRDFLSGLSWDAGRRHLQDVDWLHSIVRRSEVRWESSDEVVGTWCHHDGARISTGHLLRFPDRALMELHRIIAGTVERLAGDGRMTVARRQAAAESLWHCVHHGFPAAPVYWTHVARKALELDPLSRPAAFGGPLGLRVNPLVLEWCLYPHRWARAMLKRGRHLSSAAHRAP